LTLAIALPAPPASAGSKVKLHGYITARPDDQTVAILDDRLELTTASRITGQDAAGEHAFTRADLVPGMLIEAEGQWLDHHKFFAEKLIVDLKDSEKQVHGTAYLQEEPAEGAKISKGEAVGLKADGYWLDLGPQTRREWDPAKIRTNTSNSIASGNAAPASEPTLAGLHVNYAGVRRSDGRIAAEHVELGPPAPADAYKMPHDLEIVRGKDPQTGINVVEFRQGKKVQGRMKLLAVPSVQEYVSRLGDSLWKTRRLTQLRCPTAPCSSILAYSAPSIMKPSLRSFSVMKLLMSCRCTIVGKSKKPVASGLASLSQVLPRAPL